MSLSLYLIDCFQQFSIQSPIDIPLDLPLKMPEMPVEVPSLPQISEPIKEQIASQIQYIITIMEGFALFAAAIAGFILARKLRFDAVSTFIIGFVSAFGGGTLRDILLDRRPFYWVAHENYAIAVFILSLVAPFAIRVSSKFINETWFNTIDAIGLGLFTAAGTAIALEAGMPSFTASLLGVMTAVFGGVIRDVMLNQIPWLLTNKQPYASCAFLGAWAFILLQPMDISDLSKLLLSSVLVIFLRLWTSRLKIELDLFIFKR
jgi:uncharacterized membrane protein YeiH